MGTNQFKRTNCFLSLCIIFIHIFLIDREMRVKRKRSEGREIGIQSKHSDTTLRKKEKKIDGLDSKERVELLVVKPLFVFLFFHTLEMEKLEMKDQFPHSQKKIRLQREKDRNIVMAKWVIERD